MTFFSIPSAGLPLPHAVSHSVVTQSEYTRQRLSDMGDARVRWAHIFAFLKLAWKIRCGPKVPQHKVDMVSVPKYPRTASKQGHVSL